MSFDVFKCHKCWNQNKVMLKLSVDLFTVNNNNRLYALFSHWSNAFITMFVIHFVDVIYLKHGILCKRVLDSVSSHLLTDHNNLSSSCRIVSQQQEATPLPTATGSAEEENCFRVQVDVLDALNKVDHHFSWSGSVRFGSSVSLMASRRPDSFDGFGYRGRDDPLSGSGYPVRSAGAPSDPLHHHWVTTPPDIPGSRNLHPGDRTPLFDEPSSEQGGSGAGWEAADRPVVPPGGRGCRVRF